MSGRVFGAFGVGNGFGDGRGEGFGFGEAPPLLSQKQAFAPSFFTDLA